MRWFLLPAARRAFLALCMAAVGTPAFAQQDVKIGIGFGIAFLPTYLCDELKGEFGSAVQGVQSAAEFMGRIGQLKYPPKSWKDIVTPSIADTPSS